MGQAAIKAERFASARAAGALLCCGLAAMVLAAATACDAGGGNVHVTVTSAGLVRAVASLHVRVTVAGAAAAPLDVPVPGGARDLPPAVDFALIFDADHRGEFHLVVEALDAIGKRVASASASGTIDGGKTTEAVIVLSSVSQSSDAGSFTDAGTPDSWPSGDAPTPTDGAFVDAATAADLATSDGTPPDLAHVFALQPQTSGTGMTLFAVWGASASDVYAVGAMGTILHTTNGGANWSAASTPTLETLTGVWGTGPNDVYAVGSAGTILHSTNAGASFAAVSSGVSTTIRAVAGSGAADVYAVGEGGVILRSGDGGTSFKAHKSGTQSNLFGVWAASAKSVYVVGAGGLALHCNDGAPAWGDAVWTVTPTGTTTGLTAVSGTSDTDVYAVGGSLFGADAVILRSVDGGQSFQTQPKPFSSGLFAVSAAATGVAWVAGADLIGFTQNAGQSWVPLTNPSSVALFGAFAPNSSEVFLVGTSGAVIHGQ